MLSLAGGRTKAHTTLSPASFRGSLGTRKAHPAFEICHTRQARSTQAGASSFAIPEWLYSDAHGALSDHIQSCLCAVIVLMYNTGVPGRYGSTCKDRFEAGGSDSQDMGSRAIVMAYTELCSCTVVLRLEYSKSVSMNRFA